MNLHDNAGRGPGVIAPDGCAVDVYAMIGDTPERAAVVAGVCPPGGSVLDLGCGAGAIANPLARDGFRVVAVDESAAMLARVTGAETVHADIVELALGERFDVVLLASFLFSLAGDELRRGFLASCRRHVADGGRVVLEWRNADWWDAVGPRLGERAGVQQVHRGIVRDGDVLTLTEKYIHGDREWEHRYAVHRITDERLGDELSAAGLEFDSWLTDDRRWLSARPH
ncbi:MAG: methyltransferase domain-containing protein [Propionibacteriales bacterium]|nr:methyltransferase domain-containing protein [Propionibacteriales bacterium]